MKKRIEIAFHAGKFAVDAYVHGFFAIYRQGRIFEREEGLKEYRQDPKGRWLVVHLPSGLSILSAADKYEISHVEAVRWVKKANLLLEERALDVSAITNASPVEVKRAFHGILVEAWRMVQESNP